MHEEEERLVLKWLTGLISPLKTDKHIRPLKFSALWEVHGHGKRAAITLKSQLSYDYNSDRLKIALKKIWAYLDNSLHQFRQLSALLLSLTKKQRQETQEEWQNYDMEFVEQAVIQRGTTDCAQGCFYCL